MGSKRPYAEVEASPTMRDAAANKKRKPSHHHHRPKDGGGNAPQSQSLNEIKKRARDIERRFARGGDMPSDVQRNLELELAHCRRQIEDLQHKKKRNEMISRYHKVRFFERQKAERLRKQLKRRLDKASDPQEKAVLEEDFHKAEVDWYYTKYFPFMERYIGLYPAGKAKEDSGEEPIAKRALHSERPPVWKEIEEAMEQGPRALERIQERRAEKPSTAGSPQAEAPVRVQAARKRSELKESKPGKATQGSKAGASKNQDKRRTGRPDNAETEEQDSGEESDFFG